MLYGRKVLGTKHVAHSYSRRAALNHAVFGAPFQRAVSQARNVHVKRVPLPARLPKHGRFTNDQGFKNARKAAQWDLHFALRGVTFVEDMWDSYTKAFGEEVAACSDAFRRVVPNVDDVDVLQALVDLVCDMEKSFYTHIDTLMEHEEQVYDSLVENPLLTDSMLRQLLASDGGWNEQWIDRVLTGANESMWEYVLFDVGLTGCATHESCPGYLRDVVLTAN